MENSRSTPARAANLPTYPALRSQSPRGVTVSGAEDYAARLRTALAELGIDSHVNGGHDLAVVSVWTGLTIWCNLQWFWWRTGWNRETRRPLYTHHPVASLTPAARRVASDLALMRAAAGELRSEAARDA